MVRKWLYAYIIVTVFYAQAFADEFVKSAQFRTTFEEITLPGDEYLGIQGFTLLYEMNDYISIGPAAYGAITGQRGGFITVGLAMDVGSQLSEVMSWNSGIFVGGGGGRGGYTIHGGGLQVRSHLGLDLHLPQMGRLGVGASYQDFPNGFIHSFQPYVSYTYDFDALLVSGWKHEFARGDKPLAKDSLSDFSVVFRDYKPRPGVLNNLNQPQYPTTKILGTKWRRFVGEHAYFKAETEGAMGGKSTGFMQILFGGGYRFHITDSTQLLVESGVGVAGGGHLSTAGGLIVDASLSLKQHLFDDLFLELGGGYVVAPDGDFKATSLNIGLGYEYRMPDVHKYDINHVSLAGFKPWPIRVRYVHQTYLQADDQWRNHHADLNVHLLGFKTDVFVMDNIYLTSQAIAAYAGQAGNYMTGSVGIGWHHRWSEHLFSDLEVLVGAAGGGGLDVAGGLVAQTNIDFGYQWSPSSSVSIGYGEMNATGGHFKAHVIGAAVSYDFSMFSK